MARSKIYIFKLSDDERATLQKNISQQKKNCKTVLKQCLILHESDEEHETGLTHPLVAHSYAV